jgi:hypothetical protein
MWLHLQVYTCVSCPAEGSAASRRRTAHVDVLPVATRRQRQNNHQPTGYHLGPAKRRVPLASQVRGTCLFQPLSRIHLALHEAMTLIRRKIVLYAAGAVMLVLALLVVLPFIFRDRIAARLQTEISRSMQAEVSWSGVRLSLLRGFPYASLRLDNLVVQGRDRFAGETLANVSRFRLAVDLPSLVRSVRGTGPLVIRSVEIDRPTLRLLVLEDGSANWDIFGERADTTAGPASPLALKLRRFEIREGSVSFDDRQTGLAASVTGLRQSLSGDFGQARFTLGSRTDAEAVSLRFAGVPYLSQVRTVVDAELDMDLAGGTLALRRTDIRLNDLMLALAGSVGLGEDSLALDLAFHTPGTAFQEILSLVPAIYRQDFAELRAAGTMAVTGSVRGAYGPTAFPALALQARVENGWFQYPDLPLPARDVFLDLSLHNPGGDPDHTVVSLRRFQVVIGNDPIEGSFSMRTPVSDPAVEFALRGRLDLADLNRTLKLPGAEELVGTLAADASMKARYSDVDGQRYDRVHAEGFVRAAQVAIRMEDLPHALQVAEGQLRFTPQYAELASFQGRIGSSDLAMTGRLDNLLGFAFRDEELRGQARITSSFFDLNEWRSGDGELDAVLVPRNLDLSLVADVQRLAFLDLDLRDAHGSLRIKGQRATLEDFRMAVFGGTMAVTGFYETITPERPTFDVGLRLAAINVAEAAGGVATVRSLAPVARYADGRVSTELRLRGALGSDMTPELGVLSGRGYFESAGLVLQGFPVMERLADVLKTEALRNPGLAGFRSSFTIDEGRLHVSPFDVRLGQFAATVSGSHGFDESLDYALALQVPASTLGSEANRAVAALASQAGRVGLGFQPADVISLGVRLGGTVRNPAVATDFRGTTTTAAQQVASAIREEGNRRIEAVGERVDGALNDARRRSEAEARRILEEAERQGTRLRAEAEPLAEAVRREGYEQADALVARANNPAARVAAQAGANRLRRESDEKADRIVREADLRADALLSQARTRAEALTQPDGPAQPPGS